MSSENNKGAKQDIKEIKETDNKGENKTNEMKLTEDEIKLYTDFLEEFQGALDELKKVLPIDNNSISTNKNRLFRSYHMIEDIKDSLELVSSLIDEKLNDEDNDEDDDEEEEEEVTIGCCEYILTRGPRKGEACGIMCSSSDSKLCKKHTKVGQKDK